MIDELLYVIYVYFLKRIDILHYQRIISKLLIIIYVSDISSRFSRYIIIKFFTVIKT